MVGLTDQHGRQHTYLRVSVTDRCNYRCTYCLPESGVQWKRKADILTYEELARLIHLFAELGITHVRLTGGEPTLRLEICNLIKAIASIKKIKNIAMTTNAHRLSEFAPSLAASGLNRINVSLDTLDEQKFKRLTRGGNLNKVMQGIIRANEVGIWPIKINAVLLKDQSETEILPLLEFCAKHQFELRFIEYMPFEARWHPCLTEDDVRRIIAKKYSITRPTNLVDGQGPAKRAYIPDLNLHIGFISPLSHKFCDDCNRLRLGSDGYLRTCLAHEDTPSLRDMLRGQFTDDEIKKTIREIVWGKKEGHSCEIDTGVPFEGVMTQIGG